MAVKATFAVDFSSFSDAVTKANVQMGDLEANANKVAGGLTRMGASLSGEKIITQAQLMAKTVADLGGATKLTGDEQDRVNTLLQQAIDKYNALGKDVPPQIQAVADATKAEIDARTKATDATQKSGEVAKTAANEVGAAWKDLTSGINVQTILTDPVHAAAEGFGNLAEVMGSSLGVAAGLTGAVVGIGAALGVVTERAMATGERLDDMSDLTGLSVEALSKLSYAAGVGGRDMDTFSKALFMFEKNLGSAEPEGKLAQALDKMGLSLEYIKSVNPDQYLPLIAEGFETITDHSERASVAAALFNKSAREMIPALHDLAAGYEMTAGMTPVTAEQAKQAKEFAEDLNTLKVKAEAWAVAMGNATISVAKSWADMYRNIRKSAQENPITGPPLAAIKQSVDETKREWGIFSEYVYEKFHGIVVKLPDEIKTNLQPWIDAKAKLDAPPPAAGSDASVTAAFAVYDKAIGKLNEDSAEHTAKLKEEQRQAAEWANVIDGLTPVLTSSMWDGTVEGALKLGGSIKDVAAYFGMTENQVKQAKETMEATTAVMKLQANAVMGISDALAKKLEVQNSDVDSTREYTAEIKTNTGIIQNAYKVMNDNIAKASGNRFAAERQKVDDWVNEQEGAIDYSVPNWVDAYNTIHAAAKVAYGKIDADEKNALDAMHAQEFSWATEFTDLVTAMPKALMSAFSGTGSISDALGKTLTSGVGQLGQSLLSAGGPLNGLANAMTSGIGDMFGKSVQGIFGAVLPGLGSLLGAAVQPLMNMFSNLFSNPEKQINPVREAFVQAAGGLGALNQQAMAATGSLTLVQNLLNAKNADQYNAAVSALNTALANHQKVVDGVQTTYGTVATKLATLTSISPTLKTALDAALNSKTADDFATALGTVGTAIDDQIAKQDHLNSLIQTYGLNWADADKTFTQSKIDEVAQGLIGDFTDLSGIFSNMNPVMEGMKNQINDFIQKAQETGTVVPAGMQRVIQTAIDAGTVFDKAGNQITDLNQLGITFGSETSDATADVSKAMSDLGTQMANLTDPFNTAIGKANDLAKAVANIPTNVSIRIHYDDPGLPVQTVPVADVPGFAEGSHGFLDFGRGSLAMLHGREAIVPIGDAAPSSDEHLIALRQDVQDLRAALLAEQRLAPERLMLAMRGLVATAR